MQLAGFEAFPCGQQRIVLDALGQETNQEEAAYVIY
jgi:hypothetical protein